MIQVNSNNNAYKHERLEEEKSECNCTIILHTKLIFSVSHQKLKYDRSFVHFCTTSTEDSSKNMLKLSFLLRLFLIETLFQRSIFEGHILSKKFFLNFCTN